MEQQATSQSTTTQSQALIKNAMKQGAIMAAISIILMMLIYVIDYSIMGNMWFGLFIIAFSIGYVIYAGISYRKEIGGFLPYGKAFQHGYILLLTGGIIGSIFSILLYTVIDPELPQKLTDVIVENTEAMMQKFGAPEGQIETKLDEMRADMPAQFSAVGVLKQMGWNLIIYAVLSAVTGLIVKRNEPETI